MTKELLTKTEVIAMLGVSRATFDRMRSRGHGPKAFKPRQGRVDGRPRWTRESVEKWLRVG